MKSIRLAACLFVINIAGTLITAQTVVAASAENSSEDADVARRFAMNIKNYNVTPTIFHDAAYRALIKRGWTVEVNEATRLVGMRTQHNEVYKVEISWVGDIVTVAFVPGFHKSTSRNWLKNLGADIKQQITPFKKNRMIEVVPPQPSGP